MWFAQADNPCILAIDEFQQIQTYSEKNVEALLRTKIQQCQTAQFIFAGSKRHMMSNMFNSPAKPFYQSAISMGLEAIPVDTFASTPENGCCRADMIEEARKNIILSQ